MQLETAWSLSGRTQARPDRARPVLRARPRIIIAGEFGAGKSSVINAMLRRPLLPYKVGTTNRPLITLYHAPDTGVVVTPWAGAPYELPAVDREHDTAKGLVIRTPMTGLEGAEIVELPSHHDGVVEDGVIEMMASADLLIWVTIASQAWRLTEKSVLQRLPQACRMRAVLAVSRGDKLRSNEDREKITSRIRRENPGFFREIVFMKAGAARLRKTPEDNGAWAISGGARLMSIAQTVLGDDGRIERPLPDHAHAAPATRTAAKAADQTERSAEILPFDRAARSGLRDSNVPVFVRSRQRSGIAPAEANPPFARAPLARSRGRRDLDAVTEEIEGILDETHGLEAGGIGNFRDLEVVKSFKSKRSISVDALVLASAVCLDSAVGASDKVAPQEAIKELNVKVGPVTFQIMPIDPVAGTFAFFLVQPTRVKSAVSRALLRRVVTLWGEARL